VEDDLVVTFCSGVCRLGSLSCGREVVCGIGSAKLLVVVVED
jgi:hypothetical protein